MIYEKIAEIISDKIAISRASSYSFGSRSISAGGSSGAW